MDGDFHKARIDRWDAPLSEADRWRAYESARNTPWHKAAEWVGEEFGVDPPSRSAWYRWLARMRREEAAERLARAAAAVSEAKRLAGEAGGDDALEDALKALAADAALNASDPEAALRYVRMAAGIARARESRARLALDRERFEEEKRLAAAASEAANAPELTDAERLARIRSIFGLA